MAANGAKACSDGCGALDCCCGIGANATWLDVKSLRPLGIQAERLVVAVPIITICMKSRREICRAITFSILLVEMSLCFESLNKKQIKSTVN